MSYIQLIQALKSTVKVRDESGRFSTKPGGNKTEGVADPDETEEERERKARKLKLRAEQNKRRDDLNRKQRERRDVPEAHI